METEYVDAMMVIITALAEQLRKENDQARNEARMRMRMDMGMRRPPLPKELCEPVAIVPSTPFRFLDLPAEIQQGVYQALFQGQVIVVNRDYYSRYRQRGGWWGLRRRTMGLNILFVSKKCRNEAKPVLFSAATFEFKFTPCLPDKTISQAPKGFGSEVLSQIRSLETSSDFDHPYQMDRLLNNIFSMSSLHDLTLRLGRRLDQPPRPPDEEVVDTEELVTALISTLRSRIQWSWEGHRAITQHILEVAKQKHCRGRYLLICPVILRQAVRIPRLLYLPSLFLFCFRTHKT